MKKNKQKKPMTLEQLADIVEKRFTQVDKRMATKAELERLPNKIYIGVKMTELKEELDMSIDHARDVLDAKIEERTFTPDQKEDILLNIKHLSKWMEDAELGKGRIALTRPEYDDTQKVAGFPHRFAS